MPHYADGTEAKVGDQVTGHLYNTPGVVAGTIVSITPGVDSCNAMVQYTRVLDPAEVTPEGYAKRGSTLLMAVEWDEKHIVPGHRIKKSQMHQSDGPEVALVACADYCAINELTKVGP